MTSFFFASPSRWVSPFISMGIAMFFLAGGPSALAQSEAMLRFQIEGLAEGDTIYLANYYGNKMYYADTAVVGSKGRFDYPSPPADKGGKYGLVLPSNGFVEMVLTGGPVSLNANVADLPASVEVEEGLDTKLFYEYLAFIQDMREKRAPIDSRAQDSTITEAEMAQLKQDMAVLNLQVEAEQDRIQEEYGNTLFAKMIKMVREPDVPEAPMDAANPQLWRYYQFRDMYWNRVDFSDGRLVRDPALHNLLEQYWNSVMPQLPDTALAEVNKLIARSSVDPDMFKYFVHFFTFSAEKSQVMCMDKVFVDLVDRYYSTGRAEWLNDEQLKKVTDRAEDLRYSLCGNRIPNIVLPDTSQQNWVSLYDVESEYTLVSIWESTCGHCKKEMPKLQELYEEWHPKGLEIYAIGNDFEPEPWLKFLREKDISDWIHVSDNPQINAADSATALIMAGTTTLQSLNFRTTFDVFATPKMFLLDKDKRVIAKQVGAEQIGEILARESQMKANQ
jgi:thiol-disulfide isomerase/thioredoxin